MRVCVLETSSRSVDEFYATKMSERFRFFRIRLAVLAVRKSNKDSAKDNGEERRILLLLMVESVRHAMRVSIKLGL